MKYAVTIGTASWRASESIGAGEVEYPGIPGPNMIWDAGLGNIRPMTQPEIDAIPAQLKAAREASEPDLVAMRDAAAQAVADINTYLAIASPTNAQVMAELRANDQRQRAIIKALVRLTSRIVP